MARQFLIRGLLAGLIAGIVAFGVATVLGEPSIEAAIALETAPADSVPAAGSDDHDHAPGTAPHSHGEAAEVPRTLQATLGLLTATAVAGTTLGGVAAMIVALLSGRVGGLSLRATSLAVATAGFVATYAVPFWGYPPNPPAVGSGDTIGTRTALYFVLVAISVIGASAAAYTGRRLADRWGSWYAALTAVTGYLITMAVVLALLPAYDEVPAGFPASLLFEFRAASFVTQLALWAALGVALGELLQRLVNRSHRAEQLRRAGLVNR